MPTVSPTASSPSSDQGVPQRGNQGIRVTRGVRISSTQVPSDISELTQVPLSDAQWKACFVPADHISDWERLKSTPGISFIRETHDAKFYEFAINESYILWLKDHNFSFEIDKYHERTRPLEAEALVAGARPALWRTQSRFLRTVMEGIRGKQSRGLESLCRRIAPPELRIPIELSILNYDVLKSAPEVQTKLVQSLVFLCLSSLTHYDSSSVIELLKKDENDLLEIFRKNGIDLFKPGSAFADWNVEFHKISLIRRLLVICGGDKDNEQYIFDESNTAHDNLIFYASLVGTAGSNIFGNFDSHAIREQCSKSKVFTDEDLRSLDVQKWTDQLRDKLPIGFPPGQLNIPAELIHRIGISQVNDIHFQM
ncbi:hypothetical protein UCRPC4_g06906 [Phaeomoniella chlamydospora]|uniref:Uncharacterized protein n=1 Tax=Phaeomoniella chlamydospora TaxID=158046 RepID=A0A0G2G9S9_PHACM|nr:hypothetical protein UCRPC4_g06906 [Phaeomoniella chlamydospora]